MQKLLEFWKKRFSMPYLSSKAGLWTIYELIQRHLENEKKAHDFNDRIVCNFCF